MSAIAPPIGSTKRCQVHRAYGSVLVVVDVDDDRSEDPFYVVVLDPDQGDRVGRGDRGVLTRVDAGWRGPWRFDLATD